MTNKNDFTLPALTSAAFAGTCALIATLIYWVMSTGDLALWMYWVGWFMVAVFVSLATGALWLVVSVMLDWRRAEQIRMERFAHSIHLVEMVQNEDPTGRYQIRPLVWPRVPTEEEAATLKRLGIEPEHVWGDSPTD